MDVDVKECAIEDIQMQIQVQQICDRGMKMYFSSTAWRKRGGRSSWIGDQGHCT